MSVTRSSTQGTDQQAIQGIRKDLQTMSTLPLGGATYTPTTLEALVQSRIDAANRIVTTKAAWLDAVKTYLALSANVTLVLRDLRQVVIAAFGPTSPKLADFGFLPPKIATQTPEQKAAAVAKRAATRKARGTLGPKQKAKITGAVTPPPATPAAPATAPAASPPPAASAAVSPVTINVTSTAAAPSPAVSPAPAPALAPGASPAPAPTRS